MPDPLRHVRALAGPRESAGPGEAAAARYIAEAARAYTHQVWMEPFTSFLSPLLAFLPILGLSLLGVLCLLFSPHLAAFLTVVAAVLYGGQALRWIELGWLFPKFASQNVVAVVPSTGVIRRRVILVAHIDSPRGPDRLPWWCGAGVLLLPVCTALAAGTEQAAWAWAALAPGAAVALGLAFPHRALGVGSATGAAVVLAAGEALARAPLKHTEVWTVFTGCREPGLAGLRFFLQAYGPMLADADFLVLDRIGDGQAVYARAEAGFPVRSADPDLVGMLGELGVGNRPIPARATQAALLLDEGHRAVSLLTSGSGQPTPRLLHEFVRILSALGDAVDRDASVEAPPEPGGM
ncbi:MAG TPA: hypothetical protein VNT75_02450 [Symbiobacteriaceae bacterium]|nr:hypothetical protein [Symbiobacteriaceae bacterium]